MIVSIIGCKNISNAPYVAEIVRQAHDVGISPRQINLPETTEGFDRLVYRIARELQIGTHRFVINRRPYERFVYRNMIWSSDAVIFIWDGNDEDIAVLVGYADDLDRRIFNHVYIDQEPYTDAPYPFG